MSAPAPYRLKDALLGLFIGAWLVALPGYGLFSMSQETLRCTRTSTGEPMCRLLRRVAWIPVRDLALGAVREATLESSYSAPRYVQSRRFEGGYTFNVRYHTVNASVDGVNGPSRDDHEAIVDGLNAFLLDGAAASYEGSIAAGPLFWRSVLWILLFFGALCLINIPFAMVRALRGSRASG